MYLERALQDILKMKEQATSYIITVITLWIVAGREYGKKKRHIATMQKNAG